jgi:hypothetical protein
MKRVYKYSVPYEDKFTMELPIGATLLHFDMQNRIPTLWALVDPSHGMERRTLRFAGTGHDISDEAWRHVGSTIDKPLGLVWHLFELEAAP